MYKRRVGKLVISVCIKAGLTDAFYGMKKSRKFGDVVIFFNFFNGQCVYSG